MMTLPLPAWTLLTNASLGYATIHALGFAANGELPQLTTKNKVASLVMSFIFGCTLSTVISLITPLYDRVFSFLPPILREGVTVVTHLAAGCVSPWVAQSTWEFIESFHG